MKKLLMKIYYTTALGTILQRLAWNRQHSAKHQIRKIKKGLNSGEQNRSLLFNQRYSSRAWSAPIGYEFHFDCIDNNDAIIRYFSRRGYTVEKSRFGKNLYIYKRR